MRLDGGEWTVLTVVKAVKPMHTGGAFENKISGENARLQIVQSGPTLNQAGPLVQIL